MSDFVSADEVLAEELQDRSYRTEWERTALGRAIANVVIGYRVEHGLTQSALASRLGMHQSAVARLEIGDSNPSFETIRRVVNLVGVPIRVQISPTTGAARLDGGVTVESVASGARLRKTETRRLAS